MLHRHLNHEGFTLAAIDDIISRGLWSDWQALRRAALDDPLVMAKVHQISLANAADPYAQRHYFWLHYAHGHGAGQDQTLPEPAIQTVGKCIETGIMEFKRDTQSTSVENFIERMMNPPARVVGKGICIPPPPDPAWQREMLRFFAIEILKSNASQAYIDFHVVSLRCGPVGSAMALAVLDELYPQSNGQSPLQQLLAQLAMPLLYDLGDTDNWESVKDACLSVALDTFDRVDTITAQPRVGR